MSQAIPIRRFILWFTGYAILSLMGYFATSFTIPAWLVYLFILSPFYFCCLLYLLSLFLRYRRRAGVQYRRLIPWLMGTAQFLVLLLSPKECSGWKQGDRCSSALQTHIDPTSAAGVPWHFSELGFLVAVLLYVACVGSFLATLRIERQ